MHLSNRNSPNDSQTFKITTDVLRPFILSKTCHIPSASFPTFDKGKGIGFPATGLSRPLGIR